MWNWWRSWAYESGLRHCFGFGPFGRWLRAGTLPQNSIASIKACADLLYNLVTKLTWIGLEQFCHRSPRCSPRAAAWSGFSNGLGEVLPLEVRQGRLASDQVLDGCKSGKVAEESAGVVGFCNLVRKWVIN